MTKLTLTKPEVGQKNLTEEPKVGNALTAIEQWANGEIDTFNLKNEGIEEVDLSAAVKALLGAKVSGFTVTSHAGSVTGVGGELAVMEGNGTTYKLPTPTANTTVAVFCGTQPTSIKVQASGTKIYGDFITGIETITLAQLQHVTLIANGTVWLIVAGTAAPVVVGAPGTTGPNIASWGLIGSAGAIETGSGDYTVSNPSEGKYIVTWKTAKASANYAVVAAAASLTGGAGAIPVGVVPVITTKEFVVELYTPGGAHVSDKFSFMAMAGS